MPSYDEFWQAWMEEKHETVKRLLSDGLKPALDPRVIHREHKQSLLHWASRDSFDAETLALLLESGINPNDWISNQITPLHEACTTGSVEKAQLLLEHGADVNAQSSSTTHRAIPLHIACANGNQPLLLLLLKAGADPGVKNRDGSTALQVVMRDSKTQNKFELVKTLFEFGAEVSAEEATQLSKLFTPKQLRELQNCTNQWSDAVKSLARPTDVPTDLVQLIKEFVISSPKQTVPFNCVLLTIAAEISRLKDSYPDSPKGRALQDAFDRLLKNTTGGSQNKMAVDHKHCQEQLNQKFDNKPSVRDVLDRPRHRLPSFFFSSATASSQAVTDACPQPPQAPPSP